MARLHSTAVSFSLQRLRAFSEPGTTSVILASRAQYLARAPALTLRVAALASLQGLIRAEAIARMGEDAATCTGARCVWSIILHPALIEIGPNRCHAAVTTFWSVSVLKSRIENENDLLATFRRHPPHLRLG